MLAQGCGCEPSKKSFKSKHFEIENVFDVKKWKNGRDGLHWFHSWRLIWNYNQLIMEQLLIVL